MRIAFVSIWSTRDVKAWSGIPLHMSRALAEQGAEVVDVSPLPTPAPRYRYAKWWMYHHAFGRSYRPELDARVLRSYGRFLRRRLAVIDPDVVLSTSTLAIGELDGRWPLSFWTDATLHRLRDTYREYGRAAGKALAHGYHVEARVVRESQVGFYASQWAAESAVRDYAMPPTRIQIVPFGANLESAPPAADVLASVKRRPRESCRLVFIGVDWQRKRGDLALETARILNEWEIPTTIDLLGASPPSSISLPPWARPHGFVSKDTPTGRAQFERCLSGAHFLLLPSRSECLGIAIAEASAWGVPSLGAAVGGLPDMITEGVNGFAMPLNASARDYAAQIRTQLADRDAYERLAESCVHEFAARLNWSAAARRVVERLQHSLN